MKRRTFIKSTALGVGAAVISNPLLIKAAAGQTNINNEFPIAIASANGIRAVDKAVEMMNDGSDAIDAVIKGVNIIEADPDDMSVGYGGLPNEEGVVELDSCCMHGPTHNAGAVASLRNIKHPSQVAVLTRNSLMTIRSDFANFSNLECKKITKMTILCLFRFGLRYRFSSWLR